MDPATKTFHPVTDKMPVPKGWPRFDVGTIFVLKGVKFKIVRVMRRKIVIAPV